MQIPPFDRHLSQLNFGERNGRVMPLLWQIILRLFFNSGLLDSGMFSVQMI